MCEEFANEKANFQEKIQELNNKLSVSNKNCSKAVVENMALRNELDKYKQLENGLSERIKQLVY